VVLTRAVPSLRSLGLPIYVAQFPLALLTYSLPLIQAFGPPTALLRNWSSLFLNRMLNVVSDR